MASFIWPPQGSGSGGSGTVTSVSVVSANGLAGTVANSTTTPAITLSTTLNTPVVAGNGTSLIAATLGNLTEATSSILTITAGTGAVIGAGTTIQVKQASTSVSGYLSSTDWNTFNGKQASGSYITALTGGVTASGPGSVVATVVTNANLTGDVTSVGNATTLATVASAGTIGSSTAIPVITINAKGLTTGVTTAVVIAPAGTLSGTTLNSTVVTSSLTSVGTQSQALNMGSNKINAVTDPTSAQDAATKNYVDTVASSLQTIQAVTCATIGSNIAGTYVQVGGGIGDTFTVTATITFTLDGITPTLGQRVLFKDQTSGQQNGVYNITTLANVGVLGAIFTRALDYDTVADVNAGNLIPVISGTVNAQTSWLQTATISSIGTSGTPMVFVKWTANPANYLLKANNLSDVSSAATSFANIAPTPSTSGNVLTSNGTAWISSPPSGGGSGVTVAVFTDSPPSGTQGQSLTNGTWQTRNLNTTQSAQSWASLASNQVTLTSGTYLIDALAPAYALGTTDVASHKAKLYNVTTSSDQIIGSSERVYNVDVQTSSFIKGVVTIGTTTTFAIQHYLQLSGSGGNACGDAVIEVYTQIVITKLA